MTLISLVQSPTNMLIPKHPERERDLFRTFLRAFGIDIYFQIRCICIFRKYAVKLKYLFIACTATHDSFSVIFKTRITTAVGTKMLQIHILCPDNSK